MDLKSKIQIVLNKHCKTAKNLDKFIDSLAVYMPKFGINTNERIAMFLAQAIHETGHLRSLSENLNYSAIGLANTWPARYAIKDPKTGKPIKGKPNQLAISIARDPKKIANNVYANRMGNGNEASGDGWNFRGRGIFQLTGKFNYVDFQNNNPDIKVVDNPDLVANPPEAVITACWYWSKKNLNATADKKDIYGNTRLINGGTIGIADRKKLYDDIYKELTT